VIARVDVLDLASEIDLQRMERLMSTHPEHSVEVIYSPYILLVWEDQFKTVRIAYFERQSQKDMKLAEEIMNSQKVIHQNLDVKFPFAVLKWTE
jgi:predicted class III extradiol MEMO1 family dioxygenase